jgi:pyruvate kinase
LEWDKSVTAAAVAGQAELDDLIKRLAEIRAALSESESTFETRIELAHPTYQKSARNLAHYIALRHRDMRPLQAELARLGLSSLGRSEAHVMATLDVVLAAALGLAGRSWHRLPRTLDFQEGNELLRRHAQTLLGPSPANRAVRIMVTMPTEAASDYHLVRDLVARGMNCMRINCSYDNRQAWIAMAEKLNRAKHDLGSECRLSMDLAGPKLRVGPMQAGPEIIKIRPEPDATGKVVKSARICLVPARDLSAAAGAAGFTLVPIVAGDFASLRAGDKLKFTDARGSSRQMVVTAASNDRVEAECVRTVYLASGIELHRSAKTSDSLRVVVSPHWTRPLCLEGATPLFYRTICARAGVRSWTVRGVSSGRRR